MLEFSNKDTKIVINTVFYMFRKQTHKRYKNDQNQILRDESYNMGDKNALDGISSILNIIEEKVNKLEDTAMETLLNEIRREKRILKK